MAVRDGDWKLVLGEQRAQQMRVWTEPLDKLRRAADLQPAARSVRARPAQLEHLLRLDDQPRLHAVRDAGAGGGADRRLREVPAAPETGVVQPRRGDAAGDRPTTSRAAGRPARARVDGDAVAEKVRAFYERHPYPPPVDSLDDYRRLWQDRQRRRADFHLSWPGARLPRGSRRSWSPAAGRRRRPSTRCAGPRRA